MRQIKKHSGSEPTQAPPTSTDVPPILEARIDHDSIKTDFLSSIKDWYPAGSHQFRSIDEAVKRRDGSGIRRLGLVQVRYEMDTIEEREILVYETHKSMLRILKSHRPWTRENEVEGFAALHALGFKATELRFLDAGHGYFDRSFTPGLPPAKIPERIVKDRKKMVSIAHMLGRNDSAALAVGKADCLGNDMVVFDLHEDLAYVTQHDMTSAFMRTLTLESVRGDLALNALRLRRQVSEAGYSDTECGLVMHSYAEGFVKGGNHIQGIFSSDPSVFQRTLPDSPLAAEWGKVAAFYTSHKPADFLPPEVAALVSHH